MRREPETWPGAPFLLSVNINPIQMTPQEYHRLLSWQNARKKATAFKPRVPARATAKRGRVENTRARRKLQPASMLNMPKPAGHQTLPRFPSEREKVLFAAHERRKAAGWRHG